MQSDRIDDEAAEAVDLDAQMRPADAARFLAVSPHTLEAWRTAGTGPEFVRLGGRKGPVRYSRRSLLSWCRSRTRTSTADCLQGGPRDAA